MRRALIRAAIVGLAMCFVSVAVGGRPARAQDSAETIKTLDQGLAAAVRGKDKRALGRLLAAKFSFTDAHGATSPKSEVVNNIAAFPGLAESDVKINFYGPLATVTGLRGNVRFIRVWVKRALGWRLFLLLDTPNVPASAQAPVENGSGEGD